MIKLENVFFSYSHEKDAVCVINDISLQINTGEYVAIIGANGSGKSTLAKLLNCILLPTMGNVYVGGFNTKDAEDKWKIRSSLGLVFENPDNQLIASSAEEEVAFGPENLGIPYEKLVSLVNDSLKVVSLEEQRFRAPHKLSGGQKQRLAIAAIMAMRPKHIVLDEATSMLDFLGSREILQTLEYLNKNHRLTIIHITHNMSEATRADRVLVLDEGRIVLDGSPMDVFSNADILQEFGIIPPAVNGCANRLRKNGLPLSQGIIKKEKLVDELCLLSLKM